MKKIIKIILITLLVFCYGNNVYAKKTNITIDDIVAFTKIGLENYKESDKFLYTNVVVYNNAAAHLIEIECQYNGKSLKTGITYDDNLNLQPGVHTLREAMDVENCENHENASLDNAIHILKIFSPLNNYYFSNLTGYTEKDIEKYFDTAKSTMQDNGYEKNSDYDGYFNVNFNNFSLGIDAVAPTQELIREGDSITLKISSAENDNTIIHIFRSLDNVNYEEYKDIQITNQSGNVLLTAEDGGYYYKSVVEGSNNWSEPIFVAKSSEKIGSDVDQETANPQTGAIGISIALFIMLILGVTYNILNKKKNIAKI